MFNKERIRGFGPGGQRPQDTKTILHWKFNKIVGVVPRGHRHAMTRRYNPSHGQPETKDLAWQDKKMYLDSHWSVLTLSLY